MEWIYQMDNTVITNASTTIIDIFYKKIDENKMIFVKWFCQKNNIHNINPIYTYCALYKQRALNTSLPDMLNDLTTLIIECKLEPTSNTIEKIYDPSIRIGNNKYKYMAVTNETAEILNALLNFKTMPSDTLANNIITCLCIDQYIKHGISTITLHLINTHYYANHLITLAYVTNIIYTLINYGYMLQQNDIVKMRAYGIIVKID